jgi:alpha-glucoside transport system permease protein
LIAFLAPALVVLGAIVVYPTLDTVVQSLQSPERQFVGLENYGDMIETDRVVTAIKNNAIWVASAPAVITGLGLVFAILTERIRYATAIKVIVFMPMAISFLSTGVIWRLMYEDDRGVGFVNASIGVVADTVAAPGRYPGAALLPDAPVEKTAGGAIAANETISPGEGVLFGLTAIPEQDVPDDAEQAAEPDIPSGAVGAVVWRDFKPGGGRAGVVEQGEVGLPGAQVQVMDNSREIVASAETNPDGTIVFDDLDGDGPYRLQVAASTFDPGFGGVRWLSPSLVTPAIIGAFCWMWAGFAVVVIGAGLAALPRDVLEAARVDGANEWQTFRHVTLPLLAPVLGVVFVTMVINVLKIFDIVLVTSPGESQDEANVIAVEMYKTAFTGREYGLGSAVAVLLFVLVVPVMVLNLRRFRRQL